MRVADITLKLIGLGDAIGRWRDAIAAVDEGRRERVARYAEAVAGTLARAAAAFERLEKNPRDRLAARVIVREFGRLRGYVESIADTLEGRIDGRRLAGVKRRLETIAAEALIAESLAHADAARIDRLAAAEGYFRALADAART